MLGKLCCFAKDHDYLHLSSTWDTCVDDGCNLCDSQMLPTRDSLQNRQGQVQGEKRKDGCVRPLGEEA